MALNKIHQIEKAGFESALVAKKFKTIDSQFVK